MPPARLGAVLRLRVPALLGVMAIVLALGTSTNAAARVPQGFVGMSGDGPLFGPHVNLGRQLDTMVSSGVESLRVVFSWSQAQPYPSWARVPAGQVKRFAHVGVPTDFAATDQIVGLAAKHRLTLLPVVIYAPSWDVTRPTSNSLGQPANDGPYAAYLTVLVNRYGPHGSYWAAHPTIPKVPIRMWQIWNEPSGSFFWPVQPFQPTYVALLRAAHDAIKRADPGAKVILAGFPNNSWDIIDSVYNVAGAQSLFDAVDVHPYTAQPQGVITILQRVRAVMNGHGDPHKPMFATEVGWPASLNLAGKHYPFETTAAGQATKISQVLPLLARNRRSLGLAGFDIFTWVGSESPHTHLFAFAGLFRARTPSVFVAKPAFQAFRQGALALEHCRQKASVATRCAKSG